MIKKLFSKALLSVVMDKNARERLETVSRQREALKAQAAENAARPQPEPELTREQVLDSLRDAAEGLKEKKEMTPDRRALIEQAMAVQRSKEHVLNELSKEQRDKLYVVAMKSLKMDPTDPDPTLKKARPVKKRRR